MGDELVAMLVLGDEVHHINEVAGVTNRELLFLKRKFASTLGYEQVRVPLEQCTSLAYFDERSIGSIVSGVLVTAVTALILVGLVVNWSELDAGTRVPISALAFAGAFGVRRLFGPRRHRMVFTLQDSTTLSWCSKSGEHAQWQPSVDRVLEFARSRGLLVPS